MTMATGCGLAHGPAPAVRLAQSLYEHPDNLFVAAFIGSPAMNLYEASISSDATQVKLAPSRSTCPSAVDARPALRSYKDRKVVIGIRPSTSWTRHWDRCRRPAQPERRRGADRGLGNELQVHFLLDATRVRSEDAQAAAETGELEGLQSSSPVGQGRWCRPGLAPQRAQGRLACHIRRRHRAAQLLDNDNGQPSGLKAGQPGDGRWYLVRAADFLKFVVVTRKDTQEMEYRTLGRSGCAVSTLALGTMTFGTRQTKTLPGAARPFVEVEVP